ncbi:phosphopantetheine-binding protein, partial [Cupriavidus sp. DL-D2]|uniref:phosphopantetheine-binding protein n=1 Tax=Cupriavidus sp. DL-D2 TaxID=3144974 RepID=UPI0032128AAF
GLPAVGRHDNFFALGGHSLAVLQTQARVQQRMGARLPLRAYFEHVTLHALAAELAAHLKAQTAAESTGLDEIDDLLASLES